MDRGGLSPAISCDEEPEDEDGARQRQRRQRHRQVLGVSYAQVPAHGDAIRAALD
jgi:hypothetical protein